MELEKSEVAALKAMIKDWIVHPSVYELEASFGGPMGMDMTDFLSVIKRLKARFGGDAELKQEDRLTISLKDHTRFTIVDKKIIQKYCVDNRILGKPFIAITKQSTGKDSDVDLEEYNVHVKTRSEKQMTNEQVQIATQNWGEKLKAFRLITRWTFEDDDMKFDVSVVYSTPKQRVGAEGNKFDYVWKKRYSDYDIKSNPAHYEVEVELKHTEKNHELDEKGEPKYALNALIRGIGEVLRGIQKSSVLTRQSVKKEALEKYTELTKLPKAIFRGNPPKTLLYQNILPASLQDEKGDKISLYDGYNVTDKADGLRVLAFTDESGELYLIDMSMQVYRTALKKEVCRGCLLDAEWVTQSKDDKAIQQLLVFDVFIIKKKDVSQNPFYSTETDVEYRHKFMTDWVDEWNKEGGPTDLLQKGDKPPRVGALKVAVKQFKFAGPGTDEIFRLAGEMLRETDNSQYPYHTDGLIFTPNEKSLPSKPGGVFAEQFKWKPATDNTIDFLIEAVKDKATGKEMVYADIKEDGSVKQYKQYTLFVKGVSDPILMNPRDAVLNEKGLPLSVLKERRILPSSIDQKSAVFKVTKVPFDPDEFSDPYASVCKIELVEGQDYVIAENGEPIQNNTIIEMRYDSSEAENTWRWKPLRIRHDKTERYATAMKQTKGKAIGSRTLNSFDTAMDVWQSIHRPITRSMISSGKTEPSEEEVTADTKKGDPSINRYYQNSAKVEDEKLVQSMRDFHNRFIKERILLNPTVRKAPAKTLIDLAVGQGSDIGRWSRAGADFCFGVDVAAYGILDKHQGAYRRYINQAVSVYASNLRKKADYDKRLARGERLGEFREEKMPEVIFAVGDSSVYIPDGSSAGPIDDTPKGKEALLNADIMRTMFGQGNRSVIPKLVRKHANAFKEGAGVTAMMFAIHYMFQTKKGFEEFLRNVDATVKLGGYFVGCCFDGQKVFDLMRSNGIGKGQVLERRMTRQDGVPVKIWSIKREYDTNDFLEDEENEDSFGQAIEVEFLSIGAAYTEYLVPFEMLKKAFGRLGLRLLNAKELQELGLQHSTNTFDKSWEMAKDDKGNQLYGMGPQVKEFSFLNRWFIFKRVDRKEVSSEGGAVDLQALDDNLQLPTGTSQSGGGEESTGKKQYEIGDIFQFHVDAPLNDRNKVGDKGAARWLAPIARFPVSDGDDEYPTLEHYIAAMRYKYGATEKDGSPVPKSFLQAMFGSEGSIHQRALRAEVRERGDSNIDEEKLRVILKEEFDELQKQTKNSAIKANGFVPNDSGWAKHREQVLRVGLRQRWETDERFRKAVIALMKQNKYLLYYSPLVGLSYYAGMRKANKTIEGDNMIGKILMQIAGLAQPKVDV